MCLIALACNAHPDYPLLMVANRDEFHARPAAALAWWTDHPDLLAGRDLAEGGTWLGVSRSGRLAAVTNVRAAGAAVRGALSRGRLATDFLTGTLDPEDFAAMLEPSAAQYGGFNLLLFDGRFSHYVSNRPRFVSSRVSPGIHALSNAQLDTPWPKAVAAETAMRAWIENDLADEETLLAAMNHPAQAPDDQLPMTGVGLEMERVLSAAFIRTPSYGTRCTSVLKVSRKGEVSLCERRFDADGVISGESTERFLLRT